MGRREPSVVGRYVRDTSELLDWIESLLLDLSSVDSFFIAAWLRMQRKRGKSVPYRIWSALCWAEDCMKLELGARCRDVKDLAAVLRTRRMSKSVQALCIPVDIMVKFEHLACEARTGPMRCFAGIALLCAYGLKRWADVQFTLGSAQRTDHVLDVPTHFAKWA